MELKIIKENYLKLEKKYSLPSFRELNESFEIEKIGHESECLLRTVRKTMMDKIVNSLGFLDMLLNPSQAPRIYHAFIKNMSQDDKKVIDAVYGTFGGLSMECMPLEIDYSEKNEAEMIKKIFEKWNGIKANFKALLIKVGNPVQNSVRKEKSYFG